LASREGPQLRHRALRLRGDPERKRQGRRGEGRQGGKNGKDAKSAKGAKKKAARVEPVADKGLPPIMGARWTKPSGEVIACPVGSVLALRHGLTGKG